MPNDHHLAFWVELFMITQIPPGFEFIFGVIKYRQFVYPTSLFLFPSILFLMKSLLILILKLMKTSKRILIIYSCLELIVVSMFLYSNKRFDSILALDSLGFLCVLFMSVNLILHKKEEEHLRTD